MNEKEIRASMTDEQILLERKLTCEAIDGAMAFGYQNTNPPPSDDHWLAPFWKIGRQHGELESRLAAKTELTTLYAASLWKVEVDGERYRRLRSFAHPSYNIKTVANSDSASLSKEVLITVHAGSWEAMDATLDAAIAASAATKKAPNLNEDGA